MFFSFLVIIALVIFELYLDILIVTLTLMIPVAIYMYMLWRQVKKFRTDFKPKVVNLILDFMKESINFRSMSYDPHRYIPMQMFMDSKLFGVKPAVYEGEDYIEGRVDEVKFQLSELNVKEFSRVRNRLNYVFRGVFLHAELKTPLNGTVIMLPREFRQFLIRTIKYINLINVADMDGFIKNTAFRELFLTYASINVKIGEVLPDYMQKVFADYVMRTGKQIYVSFEGKNLYIAITNPKDMLEPHIFQSNVSFDLIREFFDDIHTIVNLVEEFDNHH
ncbi:MAG: hypothetical protein ACJAYJ_001835 [Saprospiraceae bacterium]|jgi:hypothetical protein